MTQNPNPPAGWYPQGDQERWWDGTAWSDNFRPLGSDTSGGYPPMFQALPQQPPQNYQQPVYGQQPGYGGPPYYQPPVQQSHTVRNLLIAFGVLFVLLVGGCAVGAAVLVNRVDDVVNDDTAGGPHNPLEITEGQAFEVAGFAYADGWDVAADELGDMDVVDLVVANGRGEADYAFVIIKLLQGNEVAAQVECTAPDGVQIEDGTTVTLDCVGSDPMPTAWDRVTIQDAF